MAPLLHLSNTMKPHSYNNEPAATRAMRERLWSDPPKNPNNTEDRRRKRRLLLLK